MGESDLLSSGNSAGILKLTQPAQKGPFLPNSTSLPSPDALRAKLTSPDHSLIGVRYVVHGLGGRTHSLWGTVLPCVSRQLLNSGGIYQARAGHLLPHPAPCLCGQWRSHSRAGF